MMHRSEQSWKEKSCPVSRDKCRGSECSLWVWNDCPDNCTRCEFVDEHGQKHEDQPWWKRMFFTSPWDDTVWSCPEYEFKKDLVSSDCVGCKYRYGRCGLIN